MQNATACSPVYTNALQSAGQLPEAFVVLGFAFYLQPMMMPLLHDMPPGPSGFAITSTAVKIVIIGTLPFVSYTEQVDANVSNDSQFEKWQQKQKGRKIIFLTSQP